MAKIILHDVYVDFPLYGISAKSLKSKMIRAAVGGNFSQANIASIQALSGINLDIYDGDRIGIVGHNGAGKSTLLRVMAGIYKPTRGLIESEGRIVSLIDQSAGLNPLATGRENIFLRGMAIGGTKQELTDHVEDIREFTGLGNYLDLPINIYSAGMIARLNFAISVCLQPDILIIDEGIGAGDAEFQNAAQRKIDDILGSTKIAVIASHSPELINKYCNKIVTCEKGMIKNIENRT